MVTMVGTEAGLRELVQDLLVLEHDAIAAYDETISKLESPAYKEQISAFRADHGRHVSELERIASTIGAEAPREGDMKQMLTTGKVKLASMMGDGTILSAMRSNEEDTVTAYERAAKHPEAGPDAKQIFERALQDELRHREWMSETSRNA